MIKLERIRTASAIKPKYRGPTLLNESRDLIKLERKRRRGEIEKHSFNSSFWSAAKEQLLKESEGKCAYCETPTAVISYGDVEHYRPKSKYWWLAYCLDNYLASCTLCNQKYKKAKFRRSGPIWPAPAVRKNSSDNTIEGLAQQINFDPLNPADLDEFTAQHQSEKPDLPNPYFDDPTITFAWRADLVVETVELIPRNDDSVVAIAAVKAANEMCGLNRLDLQKQRFEIFNAYLDSKLTALDDSNSPQTVSRARDRIQRMTRDNSAYAGMIRFFEDAGEITDWTNKGLLVE